MTSVQWDGHRTLFSSLSCCVYLLITFDTSSPSAVFVVPLKDVKSHKNVVDALSFTIICVKLCSSLTFSQKQLQYPLQIRCNTILLFTTLQRLHLSQIRSYHCHDDGDEVQPFTTVWPPLCSIWTQKEEA